MFVLGASAQIWGSGREVARGLAEKMNDFACALLTEITFNTNSSSGYQKASSEPKQL